MNVRKKGVERGFGDVCIGIDIVVAFIGDDDELGVVGAERRNVKRVDFDHAFKRADRSNVVKKKDVFGLCDVE